LQTRGSSDSSCRKHTANNCDAEVVVLNSTVNASAFSSKLASDGSFHEEYSICGSRFDSSALGPDVVEDECGDEESEKDSNGPIADVIEIALEVGHSSPSHFAQAFRWVVGITAGRIRAEL